MKQTNKPNLTHQVYCYSLFPTFWPGVICNSGHEFEHTLGDSEVQGSLAGCSPWSCKEMDTT